MTTSLHRRSAILGAASLAALPASAQEPWPSRPIKVVHGYAAGSNPDVIARMLQPAMQEILGQPVVVDPKPGAAERLAAAQIAKAPADGYTLYMMTGGQAVVSATDAALPYDLLRDFTFITTVTRFPFTILVPPASPFRTMADVVAAARGNPEKYSYGSSGIGSTLHLAMELFTSKAGIKLLHVPYPTTPAAPYTDMAEGRLSLHVSVLTGAQGQIDAGRVRPIGVTSRERWPKIPDVPSMSEVVPDYEVMSWLGFAAPTGVPQAIIDRLAAAIADAALRPQAKEKLEAIGNEVRPDSPTAFRARVESDVAKWRPFASLVRPG